MEIQLTLEEEVVDIKSPEVHLISSRTVSRGSNNVIRNHSPSLISTFFWVGLHLRRSGGHSEAQQLRGGNPTLEESSSFPPVPAKLQDLLQLGTDPPLNELPQPRRWTALIG